MHSPKFLTHSLCGILLVSVLSACNEEEVLPDTYSTTTEQPLESAEIPDWLEERHGIAPQDWLAERSPAAQSGQALDRSHSTEVLEHAASHFRESSRMIANRAVQLEEMLLEIDIHESAISLIDRLTHLPTEGTPHNFSAYCQYYFNLRQAGQTRDSSLQQLATLK